MTALISGPFAQLLEANRARFNAKFAEARFAQPRLDSAAFADLLRVVVAPLVNAVHVVAPGRSAEAAEALYDLTLDLLGQDLLSPASRYPSLVEGWRVLLPRLARFVAESPRAVVGSVTNALYNLSVLPGARPQAWAEIMAQASDQCPDPATLLQVGQVAAWRVGMAHYRRPALEIGAHLAAAQPRLARLALGLPPEPDAPPVITILDRLRADPWLNPIAGLQSPMTNYQLRIVARAGAFRGFGGLFLAPPTVGVIDEQLVVSDGDQRWLLHADAFGATFHRTDLTPAKSKVSRETFQADVNGTVWRDRHRQQFPELKNLTSAASTATTLAVTTPRTHAIFLVALALV